MKRNWPLFSNQEIKKVSQILRSGKVNYWTGTEGKLFEKEFSSFFKIKYSVAVANASLALECALKSIGIKKNDDVIVTSKSYISSASCVVNIGANPIFSDVDLNSQNITVDSIKKIITKNTKAIICVHLGGFPCDMIKIKKFAKTRKIKIIEDCSQSHGASINKKFTGSFGDIAVWSFCNEKIISTGEGGMISTNSKKIWEKIWSTKEIGKNFYLSRKKKQSNLKFRWLHNSFGTNLRMTEIQSAIGRIQLKKLKSFIKERKFNANIINKIFSKFEFIIVPQVPKNIEHAFYRYYVRIDKAKLKKGWSRDRILKKLNQMGIMSNQGSCSEIYLEKCFKNQKIGPATRLKNAKLLGEQSVAFIVDPRLNINKIIKKQEYIQKIFSSASKIKQ